MCDLIALHCVCCSCGLSSTKILAKIETRVGLANLADIMSEAYGIILSRGHLGVEIDAEKMFRVQKIVLQVSLLDIETVPSCN